MKTSTISRQKGFRYNLKKYLKSFCFKHDLDEIDHEIWGIEADYQQIGDIELLDTLRANFEVKMVKTKRAYKNWAEVRMKLHAFMFFYSLSRHRVAKSHTHDL